LSPLSSEIKVLEADMLDLPFNDECFDVVIEKGTMVKRQCVGTSAWHFINQIIISFLSLSGILMTLCVFIYSISPCFEGCIIRQQWWPMESKAWNSSPSEGNAWRSSQGSETRWHFYLDLFWPGWTNKHRIAFFFLGWGLTGGCCMHHYSYLKSILCSHILGVLYLMLRTSLGL